MRGRRQRIAALAASLLTLWACVVVAAVPLPARFGNDHDDPRTAYPDAPDRPACTIDILRHAFRDFEPARASVDAMARCPGPWSRIDVRLNGAVKGRQYDRIGQVSVGGITVLRTSSPEPSRAGIQWHVDKDISAYAPLFALPQAVELSLGNVIDSIHDGVFDVALSLRFYPVDATHPPLQSADRILALQNVRSDAADTVGNVIVPPDTERLLAEVYATGSGGGCEEFWYFAADVDGYWCRTHQGPYREVDVLIDGRLAGIAAPYPHIYTGGWSNPFLWYAIPALRAFDIAPIRYELTPFLGLLTDGKPHELRFHVEGLPTNSTGWSLQPNLQLWREPSGAPVVARLLQADATTVAFDGDLDVGNADSQRLLQRWQRRFVARGTVQTSSGNIDTTVERTLDGDVHHRWTSEEDGDDHLLGEWHDVETVTHTPTDGAANVVTHDLRFGVDGALETQRVGGKPRLTTTVDLHDDARVIQTRQGHESWTLTRDRFVGSASYTGEVPRERRNATASTRQTWRRETSDGACAQRTLRNINGRFLRDMDGCRAPAPAGDAHTP